MKSVYPVINHVVLIILILFSMSKLCSLKIGCLNIGGNAKVKCLSPDIVQIRNSHDNLVILESWLVPDDRCPHINGFTNFRSERKKKCKARRNSGGIIVYVPKELQKVSSNWIPHQPKPFG